MSQRRPLQNWKEGDRFSASHLQEAIDMLRPLSSIGGGGMTEVYQFENGTAIYTPEQAPTSRAVLVGIDSAKTPGGLYAGTVLDFTVTGGGSLDPDSAVTDLATLLGNTTGTDCYFINVHEYGLDVHGLTHPDNESGRLGIGIYSSIPTTDGIPVVVGVALPYKTCE